MEDEEKRENNLLEEGLVAVTPDLLVEDLILAYKNLMFPWPIDGEDLIPWFSPLQRGVLRFENVHVSKSLEKLMKKNKFRVSFCQNFSEVMSLCAETKRKEQSGTWINKKIFEAYSELFKQKKAYSVEVWSPEGALVGGLYGVISKKYVSGESMFFLETGASKVALVSLVKRLESLGLSFIDTQMVTPLLKSFGGAEVSKNEFIKMTMESMILDELFFENLKKS